MARNSKAPRRHTGVIVFFVILILLMIAATAFVIKLCIDITTMEAATRPNDTTVQLPPEQSEPTTVPTTEPPPPEPEKVIATATISSTGDLLMHKPIIDVCWTKDGYNFDSVFQYLTDYSATTDFALANLETTLFGPGKPYAGYPMFNCPDEIVVGAKDAGFDMLLTGNNHSFDTGLDGYIRTIDVVQEKGLQSLGTMRGAEDPKWVIQDINGIQVGMISYTYETSNGQGEYPSLNGVPMYGATYENVNCFRMNDPNSFLAEVKGYLGEMEAAGAEATMLFIHWGVEYQLQANEQQKVIAQGLCDLGIDVIVGGHPHVIQPVDLLDSTTDPNHKTVILYSMGNAVSNQRLGNLSMINTAHTEDGVWFSVTFEKYSDGNVYLQSADLIPCWVYRRTTGGRNEYNILPLDKEREDEWMTMFELEADHILTSCKNSYARTMAVVGEGLTECQTYLADQKVAREEYYYDLAINPEKYATEPTEATEATEATTAESVPETTDAAA